MNESTLPSAHSGKTAYIVNRATDQIIATRASIAAARRDAAKFNRVIGRRKYKAESAESFRRSPSSDEIDQGAKR